MIETPILFLIFNRPEETKLVFEQIRKAKPKYLFVAADGPRIEKEDERELCNQTRAILEGVDWNCELKTLYRDENLGCGLAVYGAINWFFEHVESGIILEDDCLPQFGFFQYCSTLLSKYADTEQVKMISGCNYLLGLYSIRASYYFSRIPIIWGWATWKRAWSQMNYNMYNYYDKVLSFHKSANAFKHHWEPLYNNPDTLDTWDFQWFFSIYEQDGIVIHPKYNLIRNIGFDFQKATHTVKPYWWYKHVIHKDFIIQKHPEKIIPFVQGDEFLEKLYTYQNPTLFQRLMLKTINRIRY